MGIIKLNMFLIVVKKLLLSEIFNPSQEAYIDFNFKISGLGSFKNSSKKGEKGSPNSKNLDIGTGKK